MAMENAAVARAMAAASVAGGLMGYYNKGTKASLVVGGVLGAGYLGASALMQSRAWERFGTWLGIGLSVALVGRMGGYYAKSGEVAPALILAICGALSAIQLMRNQYRL
eukprot:TRINITY_DN3548_c0_g1_i2.p1 TRINITY_DN3548_c0_g1~~TRINITY_DN3548_c0_g1_i2.p1  ORF type:complete len:109 (-),score=21.14 TRINITY_DN3548_c0_g1_i2:387-713(-)